MDCLRKYNDGFILPDDGSTSLYIRPRTWCLKAYLWIRRRKWPQRHILCVWLVPAFFIYIFAYSCLSSLSSLCRGAEEENPLSVRKCSRLYWRKCQLLSSDDPIPGTVCRRHRRLYILFPWNSLHGRQRPEIENTGVDEWVNFMNFALLNLDLYHSRFRLFHVSSNAGARYGLHLGIILPPALCIDSSNSIHHRWWSQMAGCMVAW